jgi:pyridoxine kinase
MTVLSIQSHVARGYVGNRAAVFPLERMGINVLPVHTVQFSSNAGIPGWTGTVFSPEHVADIVAGLDNQGVLKHCDAVLSGYIGNTGIGMAILDAVDRVKAGNTQALYCCDPVMGDIPDGLYVREDIPDFMRTHCLGKSDIITPNMYEAEVLSGLSIVDAISASRAADRLHALGPRIVVITSYRQQGRSGIGFFMSCRPATLPGPESDVGPQSPWSLEPSRSLEAMECFELWTPVLDFTKQPKGTGDLFSALFLGRILLLRDPVQALEAAAAALFGILEHTMNVTGSELAIIAGQDAIVNPPRHFRCRALPSSGMAGFQAK